MSVKPYFVVCAFCLLLFCAVERVLAAGAALQVERHRYQQSVGSETQTLDWQLQGDELKTRLGSERDLTRVDAALATRSWELVDETVDTAVRVERSGNLLLISGRLRGEPVARERRIDGAPWFQTLSLSLRPFLASSQQTVEFWVLRPKTLKPYKLCAQKQPAELIEVDGAEIMADKLEIKLAGIGGLFWQAHYWFRPADRLFLRYVGPSGLPASPQTVVTLRPIAAQNAK